MLYPESIRQSLAKVEESRPRRLGENYPRVTPEDKLVYLKKFHPDFRDEGFHTLKIGPNKGDRTPLELAAVLEGSPLIREGDVSLEYPDYETDVLIIGGGGAGASAALLAQEHGANVLIVTKLRFGDANTMMAQGGIQAAEKANDSPATHYLDVIGGGGFTSVPELVEALVTDAPEVIAWLEGLGVLFDKDPDGSMRTIHGGGTSRKRMHAARDYTGAEIMRNLRDEVRSRCEDHPSIKIWEFRPAVELILDTHGQVGGAVVKDLDTGWLMVVRAKSVIIATGGSGRLHYQGFPTTNHYGATADGLVLAYRVGCKLSFIDTMQYHPTGAVFPEQILGQLVTEKVRGLGAQVCNVLGEQFVYPLETRDLESALIIRECKERNFGVETPSGEVGVWLDSPMIDLIKGAGTVERELPAMVRQYKRFGIDIAKEPILIYPTLHYQNGGISINPVGGVSVPGLFVAGECAGGIHGRNRLMGNSLLDVCVFGRRAGRAAAEWAHQAEVYPPTLAHLRNWDNAMRQTIKDTSVPSPMILPDYTARQRSWMDEEHVQDEDLKIAIERS